jgi:hypothetical protein
MLCEPSTVSHRIPIASRADADLVRAGIQNGGVTFLSLIATTLDQ